MTEAFETYHLGAVGPVPFKGDGAAMARALESGVELKHGTAGRDFTYTVAKLSVDAGRVVMEGLTGEHSLDLANSTPERVLAHWAGFCAANERRYAARRAARG